jgi:N-acetyl-gamma-glutamyl-phosphate reductase
MTDVAIIGASGYGARELFRLLLDHPGARVVLATSRQEEGVSIGDMHPSLRGRVNLKCETFNADAVASRAEVALLALPHAASLEATPDLRKRGVKVIDLSADYRLSDASVYEKWYQHKHTDPTGLAEAVYGLPELFRERIRKAELIANPGCYTSASILGLAPLLVHSKIDPKSIIIDAKSGVSGAGRGMKPQFHFPECNESLAPYGVGNHRHTPEIEQVLSDVSELRVEVLFTPHLVPMDRGICATIYADPNQTASEGDLYELYKEFYKSSPFVRVINSIPSTKDSSYTNFCDVSLRVVKGRVLILSCLDNLVKGAAGVAVQNLNLILNLPETTALWD